jgi:predicted  nucleic acid-binding Zn-ribbon protein
MTSTADLWRLQETDTALDARRASLADAESRVGESDEVLALRSRADELRQRLRAAQTDQKDIDLEAEGLKARIGPAETKLYSGQIKNPKELADLQADIDQLKRHVRAVEDRDLEAMATVESIDNEARKVAAELAALEAAWMSEQTELKDRIERLTGEIAVLDAERGERADIIDTELLKRYEHVRRAHQGRAVAKLDRNLCTGCRISLPTNVVNKARASGDSLVFCPNCERILYA